MFNKEIKRILLSLKNSFYIKQSNTNFILYKIFKT